MKKLLSAVFVGILLLVGAQAVFAGQEATRIGPPNRAVLANLYQVDYGYQVWRWDPITEQGYFALDVSYDEIEATRITVAETGTALIVEEAGDISLWVIENGALQLDSPMVDGVPYSYVFDIPQG